jgi:hypothetical protein
MNMKQCRKKSIEAEGLEHRGVQLSLLTDMNRPLCVLEEIQTLTCMIHPGADLKPVKTLFKDIIALFSGKYPGFKACTTGYHNLKHTTDTALAMVRLIHGSHALDLELTEKELILGLIAALMHDVGYIQESTENSGTGARLAPLHVQRSIGFMTRYLKKKAFVDSDIQLVKKAIECTDLNKPIDTIQFNARNGELIGKMLAAADLLAQTADRNYLEKLPLLFVEFKEAGVNNYESELDLLKDSLTFNQKMNQRLKNELDGVNRYMSDHFKTRWNIGKDMYQESIDKSIQYLTTILDEDAPSYPACLKRKYGV